MIELYYLHLHEYNLQVHPKDGLIKWDYFKPLYDRDKNACKRLCKINTSHVTLGNAAKMRVRLALQVISSLALIAKRIKA